MGGLRRVRATVLVLVVALASSSFVFGPPSSHPSAEAAGECVIDPLARVRVPIAYGDTVHVGPDRIYVREYVTEEPDGQGATLAIHTRMYSLNGQSLGSIPDFFVFHVDSLGHLWGYDTSASPSQPQWRTKGGTGAKALNGDGYVHEFGNYRWVYEHADPSGGDNATFHVYTATGTFVTTVDASPSSGLESGPVGSLPVASSAGSRVIVTTRYGLQDWVALYGQDGTFVRDLPRPPGATQFNTQGALITASRIYVSDPFYSGGNVLHTYAHSGAYLGEVRLSGADFSAPVGVAPDAATRAIPLGNLSFWTATIARPNTPSTPRMIRLSDRNSTQLTGLDNRWFHSIYSVGSRLHVIEQDGQVSHDSRVVAFESSGAPLQSTQTLDPVEVHTTDELAFIVSDDGPNRLLQVIEGNGALRAILSDPSPTFPHYDFSGRTVATFDSGPTLPSWLSIYDVADCPPAGGAFRGTFRDDDGSVFENAIEWLAAEGITQGCNPPANDRFCPENPVTRGQMAAFLVRAQGYSALAKDFFVDDEASVFENAINRLRTAEITQGCNPPTNNRFCPDRFVTRGEMAAFLVRAFGYSNPGTGNYFVDDNASLFEAAIDKLRVAGVTLGCNPPTNNRFCPNDPVTRGQMAAFLKRALGG